MPGWRRDGERGQVACALAPLQSLTSFFAVNLVLRRGLAPCLIDVIDLLGFDHVRLLALANRAPHVNYWQSF